jgi:hypothetical protein
MTEPTERPAMLSVYDGQVAIGFVFRRGRDGAEAFTADEHSLGTFKNELLAAAALWRHAHGQALDRIAE